MKIIWCVISKLLNVESKVWIVLEVACGSVVIWIPMPDNADFIVRNILKISCAVCQSGANAVGETGIVAGHV